MRLVKLAVLVVIAALIASGLVVINADSVQDMPKPSVPEFTITTVSNPYDVAPVTTTTVDPYNGKETTTTKPGYHVENKTTVLLVKNQPFTSYSINKSKVNVYYQVRFKGHFENDSWIHQFGSPIEYMKQSEAEHTVIPLHLYSPTSRGFQNGDQWDIQVQALIGSVVFVNGRLWGFVDYYTFQGEKSDWSSTQTLTISLPTPTPCPSALAPTPKTSVSPSQNPTAEPTLAPASSVGQSLLQGSVAFGLTWEPIAIAVLCIVVVGLTVTLIFSRKRRS